MYNGLIIKQAEGNMYKMDKELIMSLWVRYEQEMYDYEFRMAEADYQARQWDNLVEDHPILYFM